MVAFVGRCAQFAEAIQVGHARTGMAVTVSAIAWSLFSSDNQKREVVSKCLQGYRFLGVDNIGDGELKNHLWQGLQSVDNMMKASPLFYMAYHAIHPSNLKMGPHLARALGRGLTGTFASVPALAVFYSAATVLLPTIQSQAMKRGYSVEEAKNISQGTVFLGIGSPLEFGVEAVGCGVRPRQFALAPVLVGTAFITGRLAAGILTQYRAIDGKGDPKRDLAITIGGTTFAQHGINACLQSMTHGGGLSGIGRYFWAGNVAGVGGFGSGMKQLGGTFLQRVLFGAYWNHLSHQPQPVPPWLR